MEDRRSEPRMLCADMVEAEWQDSRGGRKRVTALLEDISPSGACLQFESSIPLGSGIELHCPGEILVGVVRYCVFREIGYFIGVEFEPGASWSRTQFEPQHLLDLEQLVMKSAHRASRRKRPN